MDKATALGLFIAQLKDEDLALVMRAAQVLGELGDPKALPALKPLVDARPPRTLNGARAAST
jgi:HEAT repeat protein